MSRGMLLGVLAVVLGAGRAFAGESCSGESSTGGPVAINDNATFSSEIIVPESGSVFSISVNLVLTHTFFADLDISLISPDGSVVDLTSDNGGGGDIDGSITFNDVAGSGIVGAAAPFNPIYSPEQPLSAFAGEGMSGTWTLQVGDDGAGDSGVLQGWSLGYCYFPGLEEGEGTPESCSGEAGQGLPLSITDSTTISSSAFVGETGSVSSIVVSLTLAHTFFADLNITLTSPDGTAVDLSSNNGSAAVNGTLTFDDAASVGIAGASPPISGTYRPEVPLSSFAGEGMSGEWKLEVFDASSGDTGTLQSWAINYCYIAGVEEGEGAPESCSGEAGQGLPLAILDNDTISSSSFVGETGAVSSIVVSMTLSHTFFADLNITLTSPDGTVVNLSSDNGSVSGVNGTITFDDSASTSIAGVSPPISGTYSPEEPLSAFAGEGMSGEWKLQVFDDASGDSGTIQSWAINYCYIAGAEEGEGTIEGEGAVENCSGESGQNLPKPIADNGATQSSAFVGETGEVSSIVLSVTLDHAFPQDLDITLTSPDGTVLDLSSDNGPPLAVNGTISFDDSALTSIALAGSPITGTYRPEVPLSTFAGERMSGQWRLRVVDDQPGNTGTLQSWSMNYCYFPGVEEGEGTQEGVVEGEEEFCTGDFNGNSLTISNEETIFSNLVLPEVGTVNELTVNLTLTHSFFADLDIMLRSPDGTTIELTTDNLGGEDINGTISFDDSALLSIVEATAPIQAEYRPEQPLSTFNGERLNGTWQLTITDDAANNPGTLTSWSMGYCYVAGVPEGEGVVEGEGVTEGEGIVEGEGSVEGVAEGEGVVEGVAEGEGVVEGIAEGEGIVEGEGTVEGVIEGEGVVEGVAEGIAEGEGVTEGEGEGIAEQHSADQDGNARISLTELLRLVQIYNLLSFGCDLAGEDGYSANSSDESCVPHASDYDPQDWSITLNELIRLIQFYNANGFESCVGGEDGYCPITV